MPSFSLVMEYLTGYAVATDPADWKRAEWPPHPARIFMALAAAHFETDASPEVKQSEREALDWLATLPPPEITAPESSDREVLTVYVPVNDQSGGDALVRRVRQARYFPRVHVGARPFRQTWRVPEVPEAHLSALAGICRNVTRVGHSSSLVWVWLERDATVPPTLVPDDNSLDNRMRIVQDGAMQRLEEAFNESAIDEYLTLDEELKAATGKVRKEVRSRLERRFPRGRPTSKRPVFSISRGYRRYESSQDDIPHTLFDPNFIVLREADDAIQDFGLESLAAITHALRGLLMSESKIQPLPAWVSGHEPDGSKLESGHHLALLPLAFVGHEHANGHLMGVGIVLPRSIPLRERAKVLAPILIDEQSNQPRVRELRMGRAGVWTVIRETGPNPRLSLRTDTYSGPSRNWASVTPVLLDRMPKSNRSLNPSGWREEVAQIVSLSCDHLFKHLDDNRRPVVLTVRTEKTPFFRGSLRAMPGQGGFPQLRQDKYQVHVAVEFDRPVLGPVLLGAGRFRGYGMMRPWMNSEGA